MEAVIAGEKIIDEIRSLNPKRYRSRNVDFSSYLTEEQAQLEARKKAFSRGIIIKGSM